MIKLNMWNRLHNYCLVAATAEFYLFSSFYAFVLLSLLSYACLFTLKIHRPFYPNSSFPLGSLANVLTTVRFAFIVFIGLFYEHLHTILIFGILLVSVSMDALDGIAARKQNTSTDFGSMLDLETDAFYTAIITLVLYKLSHISLGFTVIGFLRYYYRIIFDLVFHDQVEARSLSIAKFIAANLFICILFPFAFNNEIISYWLYISYGLAVFSFGYSFFQQLMQSRA